jgi:hypothetical protein
LIRAAKAASPQLQLRLLRPIVGDGPDGNLAVRFPGRELLWNGEAMEVTNDQDANATSGEYREGWHV